MTEIINTVDRKQKYKKVAYYPGCALEGAASAYDKSTRAVGKKLGLELVEIKDWNCCGAMEVKNVDPEIQTYLSARVMSQAVTEAKQKRGHGRRVMVAIIILKRLNTTLRIRKSPSKSSKKSRPKQDTKLMNPARLKPFTRLIGLNLVTAKKS